MSNTNDLSEACPQCGGPIHLFWQGRWWWRCNAWHECPWRRPASQPEIDAWLSRDRKRHGSR